MASLYKQRTSQYWWIQFRDPKTFKLIRKSTGYRIGIGPETRLAKEMEALKTLEERQAPAIAVGQWDTWVTDYIKDRTEGRTQERYLSAWRNLRLWLEESKLPSPRNITYQNSATYLKWRAEADKRKGKYNAGRNTAILEFKILRLLLSEAVRRGYCSGNPAREVILKREPRKLFSDYTDDDLQAIYKSILEEPEPKRTWFQRSFLLAMLHGVRLNETNVNPMADVNLTADIPTIQFRQKGGKVRTKPLHPQLVPLFQKLQQDKKTETYAMKRTPNGRMMWGNHWTKFWERKGFKANNRTGCFHSLRVTVENVLREAGVDKEIREAYLSHEHGGDVNSAYDRVKIREMVACHKPLARTWLEY